MKQTPDFSTYWTDGRYDNDQYSSGIQPYCMKQSHKLIEKKYTNEDYFDNVIEIGSGVGYHLPYINHKFGTYILSDGDAAVIEKIKTMNYPQNIQPKLFQGEHLDVSDNSFDRLIASHCLEHIHHPEKALEEWSRVVRGDRTEQNRTEQNRTGILSILLPCDPGLGWRLGRTIGGRKRATRTGLDEYDLFLALEHCNPINVLISMIRYYFDDIEESWWPFPFPSIDLNLFYAVHIKNIK
ncbi:MAG: class I SAM-dependent methyltransferase [Ignavibacteria bacterium]|jgi:SAM-dependent methyltransferase|nr:class I SAM-dependent methyltransferase [Ignavibacteria bacterium]